MSVSDHLFNELFTSRIGSVSSLHRDYYENLYCVTHGTKEFHLFPPIAQPFLGERSVAPATYEMIKPSVTEAALWQVSLEPDAPEVVWCNVDPATNASSETNASLSRLGLHGEVTRGQVLYLPAQWYHRVTQTEPTVAVNYWHDMSFDCKWYVLLVFSSMTVS